MAAMIPTTGKGAKENRRVIHQDQERGSLIEADVRQIRRRGPRRQQVATGYRVTRTEAEQPANSVERMIARLGVPDGARSQ
jgi:hypothetical protein